MRELPLEEPAVEVVDPACVVSSRAHLFGIDVTATDCASLDYERPFEMTVGQPAGAGGAGGGESKGQEVELCALLLSFDIDFTQDCSHCVSFSTGAQATPTHWKQTVFHFRESVRARVGIDKITGTFACKRNGDNPRQLDFVVKAKVVPLDADAAAQDKKAWDVEQSYFMS